MLKLSNPDYFLPVIHALEAGRVLSTGRTQPMIVRGVCEQTNIPGEYVVKLKGGTHMWPGSSQNELLASYIASELGFTVPEPVQVHLSPAFVRTMKGRHAGYQAAERSIGFNFGSSLVHGFHEVSPGQVLPDGVQARMLDLLALDVLIGNPDRRHDKHNFLTNGKELLVYDHEMAFSFILELFKNPQPWLLRPQDVTALADNYCFRMLKSKNLDFSNFAARLNVIDEEFWNKAASVMPLEWRTDGFDTIMTYISQIAEHCHEFALELNRILL